MHSTPGSWKYFKGYVDINAPTIHEAKLSEVLSTLAEKFTLATKPLSVTHRRYSLLSSPKMS